VASQEDFSVYVDSLGAVEAARLRYPGARILTDNPFVAHDPECGGGVEDITSLLSQSEGKALGEAAVDMLMELDDLLFAQGAAERFGGRSSPLNITNSMRGLLAGLLHRGTMMARAHGDTALCTRFIIVDAPRWEISNPWDIPRYACPHRPLAESGFSGDTEMSVHIVPIETNNAPNDTSIDDLLLRVLLVPPAMLAYEVYEKLGLEKLIGRRGIAVGKLSEAIRETLPWLAGDFRRFERFEIPEYAGPEPTPFGTAPPIEAWLETIVRPYLMHADTLYRFFTPEQASAITDVFLIHLSAGMASLAGTVVRLESALDATFDGIAGPKTIISSTFTGPISTQLFEILKERGITFVDFEHGATTGIALTSERRLRFSEVLRSHVLMAASAQSARSFASAQIDDEKDIHEIGLADQTRRLFWKPLQRWRSRRRLELLSDDVVIMHISSMIMPGNLRPGDDHPVESHVFNVEKKLLTETYANLDRRVLYKPYPTVRYPHTRAYSQLYEVAGNIRILDNADFRYIRAATDIIVTSGNSSTLGWCVGANVPLVYLNSRICQALVSDELINLFDNAFFVVDFDADDWSERLRELLGTDLKTIQDQWDKKAPAREMLLRDYIVGEKGSVGRKAARLIAGNYV
jgi:hypothetical protein